MTLHKRVSASLAVCSLAIAAAYAETAPDAKAWWAEATKAYGLASGLEASRTKLRFEELDDAGAVTSYESGETLAEWSGQERRVTVVRAEKDGKDASEAWRKRYGRAKTDADSAASRQGPPAGLDATPFDPKYALAVTLGAPRSAGGFVEVPYSIATGGGAVEGVAVFSKAGKPVSASQSWKDPPVFVSSMSSSLGFEYEGPALVVGRMTIEGKASILVFKKRFRMSFEFSGWARRL